MERDLPVVSAGEVPDDEIAAHFEEELDAWDAAARGEPDELPDDEIAAHLEAADA
jgi:hypothetical protein